MWPFKRKKKRRRSKSDLKVELERNGSAPDIEYEEVTDVLDLALEETTRQSEACQAEARETIRKMKSMGSVRVPAPGPTEKIE